MMVFYFEESGYDYDFPDIDVLDNFEDWIDIIDNVYDWSDDYIEIDYPE